ncbi:hypothetical protein D9M68_649830 [compost metagenome]
MLQEADDVAIRTLPSEEPCPVALRGPLRRNVLDPLRKTNGVLGSSAILRMNGMSAPLRFLVTATAVRKHELGQVLSDELINLVLRNTSQVLRIFLRLILRPEFEPAFSCLLSQRFSRILTGIDRPIRYRVRNSLIL